MQIPEKVQFIIEKLMNHGYEAYAVGGCVRDTIMNREPEDWDITTSATPEQVKELFRRTLDTGIQHGTVTVMFGKEGFEVTTYRIDGEYEDHRHPKNVEFTTNLLEDLKRRDFTINAMAYNPVQGLVDEFSGMLDIERKLICCVGTPAHRFEEDALRMLRAVRFSGQLGFEIEEKTKRAICDKSQSLEKVSAERIRVEITKLLISKGSDKMKQAYETGLTKVFLPEFDEMMKTSQNNPHHFLNVGEHSLLAIHVINEQFPEWRKENEELNDKIHMLLCFTMLLHDIGKPCKKTTDEKGIDHFYGHDVKGEGMAKDVLKRLKFDNYTIDMVCRLIRWHDYHFELDKTSMRKAISKIGVDAAKLLFYVKFADIMTQSEETREEKLVALRKAAALFEEIQQAKDALTLKEMNINGRDLIQIGFLPGVGLGNVLEELFQKVLEQPNLNTKDTLISLAKEIQESDC